MDSNALLIETIRIQNGRVRNIQYHNQRCNQSRKLLFTSKDFIDLRKYIDTSLATSSEVKCRITYDHKVRKVEYETYTIRKIKSLHNIEVGDFEYSFKYANREKLNSFYNQRGIKDDILMLKNGYITDIYYANVALLKSGKWFTPLHPLLNGTQRERLLDKGMITTSKIHINQLQEFEAISIFNAMIPFKKIVIEL